MTTAERREAPRTADERTSLEGWLDFHRATLALKCEGLDDKQLREASAPPSELTLLGLVRHMAEVERSWFRRVFAHEDTPPIWYSEEDPDGEFHVADGDTAESAFAIWRDEIAKAKEAAAGHSLDDVVTRPGRGDYNLRWIYLHMIEEYARHNGHADLIRERIDGVTGD
ncbi:DinB family protein [Streptomyces antimycoticus]|uniref:DinB family protein n=2 Tax=Streptomyces violaceusniger group TaxID=2839105 RepID=A0ABD5JBF2_9ACTN|nr:MULTISPECIES: DinB family protein [Streptomyces]KUL62654.1 Mini-circle protein [Streptomyces violaceusniger]MEE4585720.1 DinB family protein [Streptomyces sp. DSM 41602]RSS47499.1 DinB family protein [Streptomyces sp. WAC05858]WJE01236.1 DinB family protein [Streptomyces antimycoticus]